MQFDTSMLHALDTDKYVFPCLVREVFVKTWLTLRNQPGIYTNLCFLEKVRCYWWWYYPYGLFAWSAVVSFTRTYHENIPRLASLLVLIAVRSKLREILLLPTLLRV